MEFLDSELIEILNIFGTESDEIIAQLSHSLLELEKKPNNKDIILQLFRNAHSLKGAARMIGFNKVQDLAHKIEDILGLAKDNKIQTNSKILDALHSTVDLISSIIKQSIVAKQEIFKESDVSNQLNILDNICETETTDENESSLDFNEELLCKYSDRINSIIIDCICLLHKIKNKVDKNSIDTLLLLITELFKYFEEICHFEIKTSIENIKVKLEIVQKSSYALTDEEITTLNKDIDNVIKNLSLITSYPSVNYHELAVEKYNQKNELLPTNNTFDYFDFENLIDKINSLQENFNNYKDVQNGLDFLKSIKKCGISDVAEKISNILDLSQKTNTLLDTENIKIILSCIESCKNTSNNPQSNLTLMLQQLEVIFQLLEIQLKNDKKLTVTKKDVINVNLNKMFPTGEVKTLHVDSSKLDVMLSQVGELITSEIKTTKLAEELTTYSKQVEDWQKDLNKLLRTLENFEKYTFDKKTSPQSAQLLAQNIKNLNAHSKKLNQILIQTSKVQHQNQEESLKLKNLITDFSKMIKNIRVFPLATIFHLFGRMARDIANERGKKVELSISGSDTRADKKIIEEIKNVLIHIIRNAVDHGIEPPETRVNLGKSPVGKIHINTMNKDNKIIIEVYDDGQGFNLEEIKSKALSKGFLTEEELDEMSDEDVMNIIFWPGFSTDNEVSTISGRGIGLDIVKSKIVELNGQVSVISEVNKGSCVKIELPVTMSTINVLLTEVMGQNFAIPISAIGMILNKKSDKIINTNGQLSIINEGRHIQLYKLSKILELDNNKIDDLKENYTIIIIESNSQSIGLIVDKILEEQEILHKKFAPPIHKLKNISGITTLANGESCLILDTIDIFKSTNSQSIQKGNKLSYKNLIKKHSGSNIKRILLIEDSLTSRTLTKNIILSIGLKLDEAPNPKVAMGLLKENNYDLIISDIDMPETNGLEFLKFIKSSIKYSHIPVIMISASLTEDIAKKAYDLGAKECLNKKDFNQNIFMDLVYTTLQND